MKNTLIKQLQLLFLMRMSEIARVLQENNYVSHKTDSTAASLMCTDYDISFIHYLVQHTHINGDETGSAVHKRADTQSFY